MDADGRPRRTRALVATAIAVLVLAIAGPAAAKVGIAEAHIVGAGLGAAGLRISAHAAEGMWDSGLDVAGGLDDARAESVAELGLTASELGPRYVVTYRLAASIVRQNLYPYAPGGPVTYMPPGQHVAEEKPWGGAITAGWYQSSPEFLDYLVEQGMPETNPVATAASSERTSDAAPAAQATPWGWVALALVGLMVLSTAAARLRRRVLAASG